MSKLLTPKESFGQTKMKTLMIGSEPLKRN